VFEPIGVCGPGKIEAWHSDDTKHSDDPAVVSAVVDLEDPDLDAIAADLAAVEAALAELEDGAPRGEDPAGSDPA
jgi:hypothetical protein